MKTLINKALDLCIRYHGKQLDKEGKLYYLHPIRVMSHCKTDDEKIVALLHDTIEDTHCEFDELLCFFDDYIVSAVDAITKRKDEPEEKYYKRVLWNHIAIRVKRYDLEDNMDIRRLNKLTAKDFVRLQKYHKYWTNIVTLLKEGN